VFVDLIAELTFEQLSRKEDCLSVTMLELIFKALKVIRVDRDILLNFAKEALKNFGDFARRHRGIREARDYNDNPREAYNVINRPAGHNDMREEDYDGFNIQARFNPIPEDAYGGFNRPARHSDIAEEAYGDRARSQSHRIHRDERPWAFWTSRRAPMNLQIFESGSVVKMINRRVIAKKAKKLSKRRGRSLGTGARR
jgi:hypothetical protein